MYHLRSGASQPGSMGPGYRLWPKVLQKIFNYRFLGAGCRGGEDGGGREKGPGDARPLLRIWGFADQSPVLGRPGLRTTGGSADLVTVTVLVAVVDG